MSNMNQVLLVDDEENVIKALFRVLKPLNLELTAALSGEAALELISRNQYSLVVTDMRMPVMDGCELLTRIADQQPNIRRIILTGYADLSHTIDSINLGKVHRYLTKPWDNKHLREIINDELEIAQQNSDHETEHTKLAAESTTLASKAAVTSHVLEHSTCLIRLAKYQSALDICNQLFHSRAPHLANLSSAIALKCEAIGKSLSMATPQLENLCTASRLHQLGLLLLPIDVSSKPVNKLTEEEIKIYRTYPALGEQAIRGNSTDDEVASIIRHHLEWFNGQGFPDRLVAHYIPIESRIIAVVSSYEQVNSKYGKSAAIEFIRSNRSTRYDPTVVDCLFELIANEEPIPNEQMGKKL